MEIGNIVPTDIPVTQQPVMDPLCKELSEVLIDDSTITVVKSSWTLMSQSVQDTESLYWTITHICHWLYFPGRVVFHVLEHVAPSPLSKDLELFDFHMFSPKKLLWAIHSNHIKMSKLWWCSWLQEKPRGSMSWAVCEMPESAPQGWMSMGSYPSPRTIPK